MTLLEFITAIFNTEPLDNPVVQIKPQKEKQTPLNEEEELIALEITEEDEDLFM